MSGFKRDETVDGGGFRGLIPDNTTVPCVIVDAGAKFVKIKRGDNAGRVARIYNPVLEVILGKFKGARIYGDVWCNVEVNPATGDPDIFGSHSMFCLLCDITQTFDKDDGNYPIAATEDEAIAISHRFIKKPILATVGVSSYVGTRGKNTGKEIQKNTVKTFSEMTEDQKEASKSFIVSVLSRYAKYQAKKAAESGATGFEDNDEDLPF